MCIIPCYKFLIKKSKENASSSLLSYAIFTFIQDMTEFLVTWLPLQRLLS